MGTFVDSGASRDCSVSDVGTGSAPSTADNASVSPTPSAGRLALTESLPDGRGGAPPEASQGVAPRQDRDRFPWVPARPQARSRPGADRRARRVGDRDPLALAYRNLSCPQDDATGAVRARRVGLGKPCAPGRARRTGRPIRGRELRIRAARALPLGPADRLPCRAGGRDHDPIGGGRHRLRHGGEPGVRAGDHPRGRSRGRPRVVPRAR